MRGTVFQDSFDEMTLISLSVCLLTDMYKKQCWFIFHKIKHLCTLNTQILLYFVFLL